MSEPENSAPDDLKLIRLNSHRIDEPDTTWATTYPYKLEANLRPPEFKTREALDRFITQNDLTQHPRLRRMLIIGPDGVTEEIRR